MEVENGTKKEIHRDQDGETYTTNNRMELSAVIEGLKKAKELYPEATQFTVTSDSSWVLNTITKGWKRKKNLDLWARLDPHLKGKKIKWEWVRGHNGHPQNEDCDTRAQKEAARQARIAPDMPSPLQKDELRLF